MNIIPNLKKIGPAFLLLISFFAGAQAQEVKWPVTYYTNKGPRRILYADVRQGYIVTMSADTVKGFIKLFPNKDFFFAVLDTATKKIRNVDIPDIVLIRAYDGKIEGPFQITIIYLIKIRCGCYWREKTISAYTEENWMVLRLV